MVIANETLARRFWPSGDPLGQRLLLGRGLGPPFEEPPRRIVGVVGDVRDGLGLAQEPCPTVYVPLAQIADELTGLTFAVTPLVWVVRTKVEPQALSGPSEQRLQQVAGGLPVSDARVLGATVSESLAAADFSVFISLTFGAFAVVLAATGVFGLMAYLVQQRVREMGLRLALGAAFTVARHDCRWSAEKPLWWSSGQRPLRICEQGAWAGLGRRAGTRQAPKQSTSPTPDAVDCERIARRAPS